MSTSVFDRVGGITGARVEWLCTEHVQHDGCMGSVCSKWDSSTLGKMDLSSSIVWMMGVIWTA